MVDFEYVIIGCWKNSTQKQPLFCEKLSQEISSKSVKNNLEGAHICYSFKLKVYSFTANQVLHH